MIRPSRELMSLSQSAYHSRVRFSQRPIAEAATRILEEYPDLNTAQQAIAADVAPVR